MSDSFPTLPETVNNRVSCRREDKASEAGEKESKDREKEAKEGVENSLLKIRYLSCVCVIFL